VTLLDLVGRRRRRVDLRFGQDQTGEVYVMTKQDGWISRTRALPCGAGRCDVDGLLCIASYGDLIPALGPEAAAGQRHFTTYGQFEVRVPDGFDAVRYLGNHTDLRAAFACDVGAATQHYIRQGYFEGRVDRSL
jgi:hypothetical protein